MPDAILLRPNSTSFDLTRIKAKLLASGSCTQDPENEDTLFIADRPPAREYAVECRLRGTSIATGVVKLGSDLIAFSIEWIGPKDLAVVRDLAEWVVAEYRPRIFSEVEGDDWTERCADGLDPMFPPELPPRSA